MRGRVAELEAIRSALAEGQPEARGAAHALGQSLRGSGGSFGFPEISEMGELLEEGPEAFLPRRVEGALALLRTVAWPDEPIRQRRHAWLGAAAGVEPREIPRKTDAAWAEVARAAGIHEDELARRVAEYFALEVADIDRSDTHALRLVPPGTCAAWGIVPLDEDDIHVRVATCDPTDLSVESRLRHLTGRIPLFQVAPPGRLKEALARAAERRPQAAGPSGVSAPSGVPGMSGMSGMSPAPSGPTTVLVVDDDRGARLLAATVLSRKGYDVLEAENGQEALELIAGRDDIRLVLADLDMPVMDGLALLRQVRSSGATANLPVVVLTGSDNTLTEAALIEEGADDYIRKPLDPRLFLARVSATLRRAGA